MGIALKNDVNTKLSASKLDVFQRIGLQRREREKKTYGFVEMKERERKKIERNNEPERREKIKKSILI